MRVVDHELAPVHPLSGYEGSYVAVAGDPSRGAVHVVENVAALGKIFEAFLKQRITNVERTNEPHKLFHSAEKSIRFYIHAKFKKNLVFDVGLLFNIG